MNIKNSFAGKLGKDQVSQPPSREIFRAYPSFPAGDFERKIFSVSELTRDIRLTLEDNFPGVYVEGEISGFKFHSSGHMYFSLKDENAQIQCVMFRSENAKLLFEMKDGLKVICFGRVSVYPIRGQYQLYAERVEPKGVGALQLRFEALKEQLAKEGLFDVSRKRPIPFLPCVIGIVTSIDGAALRDILHVIDRRFSDVHILIYPVPVQGAGAAALIAKAIEEFNRHKLAEVLIVGRGGGSLEDLWAFNEEVTARAIFHSQIPVISAVGHEVDFTIADFTADLRAATPSAAAEIVLPLKEELVLKIAQTRADLLQAFGGRLKFLRQRLENLKDSRGLRDPLGFLEIKFQRLDELGKNIHSGVKTILDFKRERLFGLIGKLETLGPLAVLKRGFSVTLKMPEGKIISSAYSVKPGDRIQTRLGDGFFLSLVTETKNAADTSA